MVRSSFDNSFGFSLLDNIPQGMDVNLSSEVAQLFLTLFGEDLLEKCSDLSESIDGQAS